MSGFQWLQAAGITVGLISALINLPVAMRLRRPHHRLTETIDRTGKALAQNTSSYAGQILRDYNNRKCAQLATSLILPTPPLIAFAASVTQVFLVAAIAGFIVFPLAGFPASKLIYPAAMYLVALLINATITRRVAILFANREAYYLCGAPWDFQPSKRWTAQYRGLRSAVPFVLIYMVRDVKKTTKSRPLRILQYQRGWRRIVANQERYYTTIKDRPARKRREIRKRARALAGLRRRSIERSTRV